MKLIEVAAAVLNQTPLDWDHNRGNILAAISAAREQQVSILCLPELCITGYGCEDAFLSGDVCRRAMEMLDNLVKHTRGMVVSMGLPLLHRNGLLNVTALACDGKIAGLVAKRHLAGDGIHYEPRWFKPWPGQGTAEAEIAGQSYPLGNLLFDIGGMRLGFEICEDAWVADRPGRALSLDGVDIILNPSASHFAFGKLETRKRLVLEGSRAFGVSYVYSNLLGNEAGRAIYDGGALIASGGRLLAAGPRFSFKDFAVTAAVIDVDATRTSQARTASFSPALGSALHTVVEVPFAFPKATLEPLQQSKPREQVYSELEQLIAAALCKQLDVQDAGEIAVKLDHGTGELTATRKGEPIPLNVLGRIAAQTAKQVMIQLIHESELDKLRVEQPPDWEASANLKEEEFTRVVSLALFDYLRKSRSAGFVVSLSGGADSSVVSCLVAVLVKLGVGELGLEGFARKLAYIGSMGDAKTSDQIIGRLLTCVYQSTRNSSSTTRNAASGLAKALGAKFIELDVDKLNEGYTQMVSAALGRKLDWASDDIALQNIQARTRGPGVWMIANLNNALLLATSNRSEAAVGYATMDGDTCGGLSPIAGIDKAFIRCWLRWMEQAGPQGLGAIPALHAVNVQQPTAELRPAEQHQTDEDDLMPYDVLDAVEKAAIRDKLSPVEVFECIRVAFPQHAPRRLGLWVERFFRLWCRNQWKRERYAPSFHLDDENLDPKTWCRFPILSGGYVRELAELRERLATEPR